MSRPLVNLTQPILDKAKTTVKNNNLKALLDTKQNVIESKIIDHIKYLLESILPVICVIKVSQCNYCGAEGMTIG